VRDPWLDGSGPFRATRDSACFASTRGSSRECIAASRRVDGGNARRVDVALSRRTCHSRPSRRGKTFNWAPEWLLTRTCGKEGGRHGEGSHKVIRNLLDEVVRALARKMFTFAACMCEREIQDPITESEEETDAGQRSRDIDRAYDVVGAQAWDGRKEDGREAVDVLSR